MVTSVAYMGLHSPKLCLIHDSPIPQLAEYDSLLADISGIYRRYSLGDAFDVPVSEGY